MRLARTNARLEVLELARRVGNVSEACRRARVSRSQYYVWLRRFREEGVAGLLPRPRARPRMPNETPADLAHTILEVTMRYPSYSYDRLSRVLRALGHAVSRAQVRGVWRRHGLSTLCERLAWIERFHGGLSERRRRQLARADGARATARRAKDGPP